MIFAALISWDGFTLFQHHNITSDIWAEHNIFFESQYDELHIMINYPTKFETYQPDDLRGVALTKWSRTDKRENYMPPNYCSWRQLICLVQWWMMMSFEWLLWLVRCRTQLWFVYNGHRESADGGFYWRWFLREVLNASKEFACTTLFGRWFQRITVSTKKELWYCCFL